MSPVHLCALRGGRPYVAVETAPVPDVRGEVCAVVSQVNPGLIRRDLRGQTEAWAAVAAMPADERAARTEAAAARFLDDTLPAGDAPQTFADWAASTSRSTGLPVALVRRAATRVVDNLRMVRAVVDGLTRRLPLSVLDDGEGVIDGLPLGYVQTARSLGAVLPSNAPGVHALWVPALTLGLPLYLKPGRGDPWTPTRLLAAMAAAGLPSAALGLYPSDHDGAGAVVEGAERSMVFGGAEVSKKYASNPRVEVHGPGFSKVVGRPSTLLRHMDVLAESVAYNGGRSCINASTIVVVGSEADADQVALALATALLPVDVRDMEDPEASLAAWPDRGAADAIDALLSGVEDVAQRVRGTPRRADHDGLAWLRPAVLRVALDHALARTELPFPCASVVAVPEADAVSWLGASLAVTVLDEDLFPASRRARHIDRLHLGPIPTSRLRWDQPHEGNLFDATWRRRGVG